MATTGEKARLRQQVAETRRRLRAERAEREREIEGLAARVMVKLGESHACEREAGRMLEQLAGMGLKGEELAQWCGGVSAREVSRLRKLAKTAVEGEDPAASGAAVAS
ncbi:hypothetical protein [Propioniciclava soli]|uniref:hypothetical protein n=1 Tax=Propioniciclava soli TaxID=2775081 RepID=UPI001E5A0577|nr:hypothetical protein [Propioniciclava soli]